MKKMTPTYWQTLMRLFLCSTGPCFFLEGSSSMVGIAGVRGTALATVVNPSVGTSFMDGDWLTLWNMDPLIDWFLVEAWVLRGMDEPLVWWLGALPKWLGIPLEWWLGTRLSGREEPGACGCRKGFESGNLCDEAAEGGKWLVFLDASERLLLDLSSRADISVPGVEVFKLPPPLHTIRPSLPLWLLNMLCVTSSIETPSDQYKTSHTTYWRQLSWDVTTQVPGTWVVLSQ